MEPGPSSRPTLLFRGQACAARLSTESKRTLKTFARQLACEVIDGRAFTCLITSDRELRKLNRDFLGHDYATDVLSFPCTEGAGLGDLAISIERAEAQAVEFGHSLEQELCVLMLHGVLHLMGMDHERDRGNMARAERKWREQFALPIGLIARTRREAHI